MYEIDKETTALSKLGLSYDMIVQEGERMEIEPVAKVARKEKYIQFDLANSIIDAYADDLEDAYRVIETLTKTNTELKTENDTLLQSEQSKTSQLKKMLAGDASFKQAETLLAQLDDQMTMFEKAKKQDAATIKKLQTALSSAQSELGELSTLRSEVPKMRHELEGIINAVADALQEAGIDIDSE